MRRSDTSRESMAKLRDSRAQQAACILGDPIPGMSHNAARIRLVYYKMCDNYRRTTSYGGGVVNSRSKALWERVESFWSRSNVDQEQYVLAQIAWFHKVFGRLPTPVQLATEAAVERAKEFSEKEDKPTRAPITNNIPHNASLADIFKQSEKSLQAMMREQGCSREEFYRKFVVTGLTGFHPKFLQADPVWRKVVGK